MRAVSNAVGQYWRRYRALPTLPRELATLGLMLLFSLTLLPVAIWFAGQFFLGDYLRDVDGTTGGFGAMWVDYLGGILTGSFGHWVAFLGPWLLLLAMRGVAALRRHERATAARPAPVPAPARSPKDDINQPLA